MLQTVGDPQISVNEVPVCSDEKGQFPQKDLAE